ncbi:hypothetical protein [Nitrosomonas sp. Is79A3]|uniref:hypothetical protein n=1 Tax=Nitrosomonas sp. (strain Is79A3) TaxID=261292 RepID=UPI0002F2FF23
MHKVILITTSNAGGLGLSSFIEPQQQPWLFSCSSSIYLIPQTDNKISIVESGID